MSHLNGNGWTIFTLENNASGMAIDLVRQRHRHWLPNQQRRDLQCREYRSHDFAGPRPTTR